MLRITATMALGALALIGGLVVLVVVFLGRGSQQWPAIADPTALVRDCETLAADFAAGRAADVSGGKAGDPWRNTRVAPDDWPASVRALRPRPLYVRMDGDRVTIVQSASGFGGGWGLMVCLRDPRCAEGDDGVVPTEHPRLFRFETDH